MKSIPYCTSNDIVRPDMDLRRWLKATGVSQRELARRLDYKGNGFITLVAAGKREIPANDVVLWADALKLQGDDRTTFLKDAKEEAIPSWALKEFKEQAKRLALVESALVSLAKIAPQYGMPVPQSVQQLVRSIAERS